MCGIAGCFTNNGLINKEKFKNALDSLDHRGPDDSGIEEIELDNGFLMLGHKRLSILGGECESPFPPDEFSKTGVVILPSRILSSLFLLL